LDCSTNALVKSSKRDSATRKRLAQMQPSLLLKKRDATPSCTVEAKVEGLKKLLKSTKEAHRGVVEEILPKLPAALADDKEFRHLDRRSLLLSGLSSRLAALEGQVASAGIWRWSPLYLSTDIMLLYGELTKVHDNTLRTSTKAHGVITQLLKDLDVEDTKAEQLAEGPKPPQLNPKPEEPANTSAGRV